MWSNKIKEFISIQEFKEKISYYSRDSIYCTKHTFFRLSEEQRELLTCDGVKDLLIENTPKKVGVQNNGCFAVFYKWEKQAFIRLLIDIKAGEINIVTFYIVPTIPHIK